MQSKAREYSFIIPFIILGIVFSIQARSNILNNRQKVPLESKVEMYKGMLDEEKARSKKLDNRISQLQKQNDSWRKSVYNSQNDMFMKKKAEYLETVRLKAGLTDVKGPGVVIQMNDALVEPGQLIEGRYGDFLVHDADIIRIVNEIKKAGAQALAFRDERIISTSAQVCAGPTVLVNNRRYAVPFIIKAIGNPEVLYNVLDNSSIVNTLRNYRIRIEISMSDEVFIPGYKMESENYAEKAK